MALHIPNGVRMTRKILWWEVKAVLSLSASELLFRLYRLSDSKSEKIEDLPGVSMHVFIQGIGYKSLLVEALRLR